MDLNLALAGLQSQAKEPTEMSWQELHASIAEKTARHETALAEEVEIQRKFSIPFGCIVFAALGIPLGIRPSRAVHSRGFSVSLVLIFAYYLLLTLGHSLGERGTLRPVIASWLPNILLSFVAAGLSLSYQPRRHVRTSRSGPARVERSPPQVRDSRGEVGVRAPRYRPLPVASRYIVRQFLGIFIPILASFILLGVIVDFFDRLDILLRHNATVSAAARYFLFKIPLMITQVTPAAVVTAVLLSFGLLSRHNEIVALRAGGVSLGQTALPVIGMAVLISAATLAVERNCRSVLHPPISAHQQYRDS